MATDSIVAGLFTTPEQYQEQQRQALYQQAVQEAKLDPYQQARVNLQTGVQGLAQTGAGMLGAQDPQMKLQALRQQVLQGMDPTDPKSLMQAAQRLAQNNDREGASKLALAAQDAAKSSADTGLKLAQAKKAEQYQQASTAAERNRAIISSIETTLAKDPNAKLSPEQIAELRWTVAQETKAKSFSDPDSGKLITIEPIDLSRAAPNIEKFLNSANQVPPSGPKVTTTTVGEPKLGEGVIKEIATVDQDITNSVTTQNKLKLLTPSIANLNLGLIANYERAGAAFLDQNTPDALEFKKLQRAVRAQSNAMLNLAKGVQTKDDAERIDKLFADEATWKNKDSLKAAFDDMIKTMKDTEAALRAKRESLKSKGQTPAPSASPDVAPNKSTMSGQNPNLQPTPETPPAAPKQGKEIPQDILDKANDAIKRGAPKEEVLKRLRDQGYSVL